MPDLAHVARPAQISSCAKDLRHPHSSIAPLTHTHSQTICRMRLAAPIPLPAVCPLGSRIDSDTDSNKCQKQQEATFSNYKRKGICETRKKCKKSKKGSPLCPSPLLSYPPCLHPCVDKGTEAAAAAATDCSLRVALVAVVLQVLLIELSQHHVADVQAKG